MRVHTFPTTRIVALVMAALLALVLALLARRATGADVLSVVPADAAAFAVIHDFTQTSAAIDDLARLVKAPAPDLLKMFKQHTGLASELDEHGDFAVIVPKIDGGPNVVVILPAKDFNALLTALHAPDPSGGIVAGKLAEESILVARKDNYALMASAADREALQYVLNASATLGSDASLSAWVAANRASAVLTSQGVKQGVPKLRAMIVAAQAAVGQMAGPQGKSASQALQLYIDALTAAESEVAQFGLGLRVDAAQTVDVVKRVEFTPGGAWATRAKAVEPAAESVLAHLPAGPFVFALGGAFPHGAMDSLMNMSMSVMKNSPEFKLTDEQADKFAKLAAGGLEGVNSMRMLIGVAEPGQGLYSNATVIVAVDDSARYLRDYEKTLADMRDLAKEAGSPAIPTSTVRRVPLSGGEALEVTMDLSNMSKLSTPNGPDMQKMMKAMLGSGDALKVYIAPADDHAVVMAYTSLEHLQKAIDFYRSKGPGLAEDPRLAKVAAALPAGAQAVGYVSLGGFLSFIKQVVTQTTTPQQAAAIPELADSPPIGVAVKVSPTGLEGHLVITSETLQSIGDAIAKARSPAN